MPKLTLLSLFAALVCVPLHAQSPDYRFGKVSEEELRMTSYDKDPEAEAVYLNEENSFYYQIGNDILITRDYRARIKILKPEGTGKADVSLSYIDNYNWRENVSGIEAAAYNLVDGKIVKTPLKKQYVFTEQLDENRKLIKFSIPEVREGTVIEYKYRISSKNITYIPSFRFQHDVPVMRSRMKAAIPEFFRFNLSMKGYVRINVNEDASTGTIGSGPNSLSYSIRNIATEAADIPALKREEYVWSLNDFRSTLDFELSQIAFPNSPVKNYATTWEDVNEALRKSTFDTHCRIGNPYKDEVAAIKAAEGTPEEKIRQVLRLVQSKMKWNEEYRLFSKGPRAAANKGTGSSADINFVLMAVLKDAGFEAVPVLLSPRHMGRLPYAHPTIDGINAFVVRVALGDGKHAYLDGTKMIGVAASVTLPEVNMQSSTVSGVGVSGEIDSPTIGQFESMEQEIQFNTLYSSAMDMLSPLSTVNLTFRAAQQVYDKTGGYNFKGLRVVEMGRVKSFNPGKIEKGEAMEATVTLELTYIMVEVDGVQLLEVDKLNGVYKVNGTDMLAEVNSLI